MGHSYSQLSLRERCEIGLLRREGLTIRVTEEDEFDGLDITAHGERAYDMTS